MRLKNTRNIIVGVIYRPPQCLHDDFLRDIQNILQSPIIQNKHCFLMGDFNVNLLQSNAQGFSHDFIELILSASFLPTITKPTRVTDRSATLIDNIFTNMQDLPLESGIVVSDISDHYPIFCRTTFLDTRDNTRTSKIKTRRLNARNLERLNENLSTIDWQQIYITEDVNEAYDSFISILKDQFDICIPFSEQESNYKKIPRSPWVTKSVLRSINRKNNLFYKYKTNPNDKTREKYTRYKNILTNVLRQAKKQYYAMQFELNKSNMRNTWKIINRTLNRNNKMQKIIKIKSETNNIIEEPQTIAETFNLYFSQIGQKLAETIPTTGSKFDNYLGNHNPSTLFFVPTDREEIIGIINKLEGKKSSGHDEIDNFLLKTIILSIATPLAYIFNLSLSSGIVPDNIKIAKVIPIFKKGDTSETKNYRPISILPSLSKVLERIVFIRTTDFLNKHNIFCESQFGFRANHNTTQAILKCIDTLSCSIDQHLHTIAIFLDFSKAFDTINHDILLVKLSHYGVRGKALEWFRNYLSNRKQFVQIDNHNSELRPISCGVPQGSILGPLLFIIYINDFYKSSDVLSFILFADDSNLFYSHANPITLFSTVNLELKRVVEWVKANKLSLNILKTNFMIFSNTLRHLPGDILLDNTPLNRVTSTKFLGLMIDDKLKWNIHIQNISKTVSRNIGVMNKLRHFFPKSTLFTLYFSLILPYLNYGIMAWGNANKYLTDKMFILQKKIIRIIHNAPVRSHTDNLFYNSNILKFPDLFLFQTGQFMYKLNINELPNILINMFTKNNAIHNYPTRQSLRFHLPRTRTLFAQKKTISFYGPKYWNSLSHDIINSVSLNCFKIKLKKHILESYRVSPN